jgi:hypothetical protein
MRETAERDKIRANKKIQREREFEQYQKLKAKFEKTQS